MQNYFYRIGKYLAMVPFINKHFNKNIKGQLKKLYPFYNEEQLVNHYYARKIEVCLKVGICLLFFITIVVVKKRESSVLQNQNELVRPDYDSSREVVQLQAKYDNRTENISVILQNQKYSKDQILRQYKKMESNIEKLIIGENEDLSKITTNLSLKEKYPDYIFSIEWESDNYGVIDADGTVYNEDLKEDVIVILSADISYDEYFYVLNFPVCVKPKPINQEEEGWHKTQEIIQKEEEKQKTQKIVSLPKKVKGEAVAYSIKGENNIFYLFISVPAIIIVLFVAKNEDLSKEIKNREKQLRYTYPEFVSKVTLLMGAGMSLRNIIVHLSKDEQLSYYLHNEIHILVRDIENGEITQKALEDFGKRTNDPLYIKFCALLIQNETKGTEDIAKKLRKLSEDAFLIRKNNAVLLGEEASSKLLFPMTLLLLIVMIVIVVPAFFSFSL